MASTADAWNRAVKINGKRRQIAEILHSSKKSGRRIERRCLNLHRKFINNRFCACAVQMLLKMAVNATKPLKFNTVNRHRQERLQ